MLILREEPLMPLYGAHNDEGWRRQLFIPPKCGEIRRFEIDDSNRWLTWDFIERAIQPSVDGLSLETRFMPSQYEGLGGTSCTSGEC